MAAFLWSRVRLMACCRASADVVIFLIWAPAVSNLLVFVACCRLVPGLLQSRAGDAYSGFLRLRSSSANAKAAVSGVDSVSCRADIDVVIDDLEELGGSLLLRSKLGGGDLMNCRRSSPSQ